MQKCILENRRKHNMDQEKVIVIDFGGQYNQLVGTPRPRVQCVL